MAKAFVTMITPYGEDGAVDFGAVRALTEWYVSQGLDGIFASCQSSEIRYLSLDDRIRLAQTVSETAKKLDPASIVVASGHVSDSFGDQKTELREICASGADAAILISNRLDIANTSDEAWIEDAQKLIDALPLHAALGVYECPAPYKRLMSDKMLKWCVSTGRFRFMKDTCCDADLIRRRCALLRGSGMALYNANAQTLLDTLRSGAAGYCGVMANFHPALYVRLCHSWESEPKKAETLQAFLCAAASAESLTYPVCAKYYLDRYSGVHMPLTCRSADVSKFTAYQRSCVDQLKTLTDAVTKLMEEGEDR